MISDGRVIVMDLDNTICQPKKDGEHYKDLLPKYDVLETLKNYKDKGFYIIISTSRNMKTYQGNIGKINANTAPTILEWLQTHNVPYDEIFFGKPWCGEEGFYVDDKAIRPDEFVDLSYEDISQKIGIGSNI